MCLAKSSETGQTGSDSAVRTPYSRNMHYREMEGVCNSITCSMPLCHLKPHAPALQLSETAALAALPTTILLDQCRKRFQQETAQTQLIWYTYCEHNHFIRGERHEGHLYDLFSFPSMLTHSPSFTSSCACAPPHQSLPAWPQHVHPGCHHYHQQY